MTVFWVSYRLRSSEERMRNFFLLTGLNGLVATGTVK